MLVKIYRVDDDTWYDASDYVVEGNNIPIYERNEDWTPVITTSKIGISFLFSETISIGDKIQLYMDATHYYNYIIRDVQYNYPKRIYDITFEKNLGALKDNKICRTTLEPLITNTADAKNYIYQDNDGRGNTAVIWAMKQMFVYCGLTLDISEVATIQLGTFNYGVFSGERAKVYGQDIKMDQCMMYLFGFDKNYVGDDTGYDNGQGTTTISDVDENRAYMWDFISEICMHFGWMIYNYQGDDFKLISKKNLSVYNPSDTVLKDKSQLKYYKKYKTSQYKVYYDDRNEYYYKTWYETQGQQEWDGQTQADTVHQMPYAMRFLFQDKNLPDGHIAQPDYDGGTFWQMYRLSTSGNFMDNWGDFQTKDYTKYIYTTEVQNTIPSNDILSMSINLKDRTTEIETIVFD